MKHEVLFRPSYSLLKLELGSGESISAEPGAMVSMSDGVEIETKTGGKGFLGALKKSILGGESFFINTFKASKGAGKIFLAPSFPGDIHVLELNNETIYAQSGSYIASSPDIEIDTKWGGAKTFFSKEGIFLLKINGKGKVFLSSYGAIHEIELKSGEKHIVDTGHIVAFTEGVEYKVKKIGGLKSTLFSGEGLVCELTGPGKIWIQSRSMDTLLSWLLPHIQEKE